MPADRVAIIGGGISGLAVAYALQEWNRRADNPVEVTLLEKSGQIGGIIRTEKYKNCLLEFGPEAWVSYKPQARDLVAQLGLEEEVIGSNNSQQVTYVVDNSHLVPLPEGLSFVTPTHARRFLSAPLLSLRGKLRALLEPIVPGLDHDPSVEAFFTRRLGDEFCRKVVEPLVSAIYGGDIEKLGLRAALPELAQAFENSGSLIRASRKSRSRTVEPGRSLFETLRGGLGDICPALEGILDGVQILKKTGRIQVQDSGDGYSLLTDTAGLRCDCLVLATPAYVSADFLRSSRSQLAAILDRIIYSSTNMVFLGYSARAFREPLRGFGFVTPRGESSSFDACTWVSNKFEGRSPKDIVLLRCAIHNGRINRPDKSDAQLADECHKQLARLMEISDEPSFSRVFRLPKAMPQYSIGHQRLLQSIDVELSKASGLFLAGSYRGGVGIPDCIGNGKVVAKDIISYLRGQTEWNGNFEPVRDKSVS